MTKSTFSQLAARDINDIWDYVAQDNLAAADRLIQDFEKAVSLLAHSPRMGHKRPDLTAYDVRFWPVGRYLIVYRGETSIEIVRILSGFRDISEQL